MKVTVMATLDLPPSVNRIYRVARGGTPYKTKEAIAWQSAAEDALREAGLHTLPDGDYRVSIDYRVFCSVRRDIDSGLKLTLDSVQHVSDVDDNQVLALWCTKVPTKKRADHKLLLRVDIEGE